MNDFKRSRSIVHLDPRDLILEYVRNNDIEKVEELLTQRPNLINFPKHPQKTLLYIACMDFADTVNRNMIKKLIELEANLQHTNNNHWNRKAIHNATLEQNPEILKTIVDFVDVNAIDSYGNTSLLLLYKEGKDYKRTECANILLDCPGIDINKTNKNNESVIFWIAKTADIKIMNRLLEDRNIDLDNYSQDGKTAGDYIKDLVKASNSYLCQAVDENLVNVVKYLLGFCINPNIQNPEGKSPLQIAASHGYHQSLKLLIQDKRVSVTDHVLFEVLQYNGLEATQDSDRRLCFKYLLESNQIKRFNIKDSIGNYLLHYTVKYGNSDQVLEILKRGASLANKDWENNLCVDDLDFDTLKKHFDMCIQLKPSNQLGIENATISFDYSSLLPTRENHDDKISVEMDVVLYMSRSPELRELLQHPLIKSFLCMKWRTIRWIFFANLIFYLFFCLSLNFYVVDTNSIFTKVFLFIMNTLLTLIELFQVFFSKNYFTSLENILQCILIIFVNIFIFETNKTDSLNRQLTLFIILLAAFQLLFLFGKFAALLREMLCRVSLHFFKYFGFYFILITSVFKIIMWAGEFEAGDIKFDKNLITNLITFLFLVITISVIFFNLVNPLAVSDLREIKTEAELIGLIAIAEYVADAESMFLGLSSLTNFLCRCDSDLCSCPKIRKRFSFLFSSFVEQWICLYPKFLGDRKLVVYPNQGCKVKRGDGKGGWWNDIYVDKGVVKKAWLLIQGV